MLKCYPLLLPDQLDDVLRYLRQTTSPAFAPEGRWPIAQGASPGTAREPRIDLCLLRGSKRSSRIASQCQTTVDNTAWKLGRRCRIRETAPAMRVSTWLRILR